MNNHAHKQGKCTRKCDGVQRRGGWPLDPKLREDYKNKILSGRFVKPVKQILKKVVKPKGRGLYATEAWQKLRYETLKKYGRKCMVCFVTNTELHVDHIKPVSKHPRLAFEPSNLQVLCRACNIGKSNRDEIDWRPQ